MFPHDSPDSALRTVEEGRRFARRMYLPRMGGLALGGICIGGGLWEQGAPGWVWALMLLNTLGAPHLAYWRSMRSKNPYRTELGNLTLDSAYGGIWIAVMHFSLAPSVVLFAMLAMDKIAVGGPRFLGRCLLAQLAAAAAVAFLFQIEPQILQSGNVARLASAPLLVIYPIMVGFTAYRVAHRVRQQNLELAALSSTDGLTRLPNHGAWLEAVEREFARAKREDLPMAVLMVDLDNFKAINDTHGHPVGDEVLRGVAEALREVLRQHDVPGRYGGEEFGVLLAGCDISGAEQIAERIRRKIEWGSFAGALKMTASIGCAAMQTSDMFAASLIARADRGLYEAKAAGRNRAMRAAA